MKRSEIIDLGFALILQGNRDSENPLSAADPMWSPTEKDFFFNEAVDFCHEAFVLADTDFFKTRGATIDLVAGTMKYELPADFHSLLHVEDSSGKIRRVDLRSEKERFQIGYVLEDDYLVLVNWSGSAPSTLTIDYHREPKEIPAWNGQPDPADDPDYVPDAPLNTNRGARVLARIIAILARSKPEDGSADSTGFTLAQKAANRFVDRMLSRAEAE